MLVASNVTGQPLKIVRLRTILLNSFKTIFDNYFMTHKEKQVEQDITKAISKFSQSFMSNSKWVRLIEELIKNIDKIKKIQFKKVHKDEIGELYLSEDTTFGFDYWENGFEGHNSFGGWLTFKEIEFLIFPRQVDSIKMTTQDLEQIMELINNVGQFNFDKDSENLKLKCYEK